jgi:D-serine deaminase-like pyridoxal phosphate-dependent protein
MSHETLDAIETPAAVVDVERMRANIARVARYAREHELAWRPHAKTHKTPQLAAEQLSAGAVGVTVATLREAEVMAEVADDILLAYPPIGRLKLARLLELPESVRLTVALDSSEALHGLADAAVAAGREIGVLVEIDAGLHRVGVQTPADAAGLAAEAATLAGVEYRGILFYPGHIREHVYRQEEAMRGLADTLESVLHALEAVSCSPGVVSGGSTPTLWSSHAIPGLTEIRPGTNIFNDRTTATIGASGWDECAYSILATVVSTSVPGQAVIDAGAKALAREELRGEGEGFGALLDDPSVVVRALSEEHGTLDLSRTEWRPRVGDRVRVVPNHVCLSVHLQERLWGVRGDRIEEEWTVAARDRSRR